VRPLIDLWVGVQTWLFETFVSPVLFSLNLMEWFEPAFNGVEFFMLGVVQLLLIGVVMRFFERRWGVERGDEGLVGVDRVYTLLSKLGVVPLLVFIAAYPITQEIEHLVRVLGFAPPRLERLIPGLHDNALASFLAYFVLILILGRLVESWSHANVDMSFGRLGARLLVAPRFHRLHHARADAREPHIHDHNFAPVFPIWDVLFGTARFDAGSRPTGVDSPEVDADNGRGWLGQQVRVFRRFVLALMRPRLSTRASRGAP
jgi:sterol desaturase/sphingolipid hydroxylase (fatty acid hydroxylase superfamily)